MHFVAFILLDHYKSMKLDNIISLIFTNNKVVYFTVLANIVLINARKYANHFRNINLLNPYNNPQS